LVVVCEPREIAQARDGTFAAPESSDREYDMTQKPTQNSSQRRYAGALTVRLKPRPKHRHLYARRRSRTLRARASDTSGAAVAPDSSNSLLQSLGHFDLKSVLQSDHLGVVDGNPNIAPALPIFSGGFYFIPGWRWEFDQKLPLLFDHYGVAKDDPDRWQKLCLSLAIAHIPGFQVRASRAKGRPRTVQSSVEDKLYARFCALRQDGHSDRNAARLLANELRKSGQAVRSDAGILRRMQRRKPKAKTAAHAV
jgi:hypothetical protein